MYPYEILLSGNDGPSGSCSCEDYQYNTLKWCKHLSCVYLYWHRGPNIKKKFFKGISINQPHLSWHPPVNLKGKTNPLNGLKLKNYPPRNKSKLIFQLNSYFCKESGSLIENKIIDINKRETFLKLVGKCSQYLNEKKLIIDPAITPLITAEKELLKWPKIHKKHKQQLHDTFKSLKFKLYPYQEEGINLALEHGRFLIADEMGLGKTIQAIGVAEALLKTKLAKKVLLICPSALKSQWYREWHISSDREIQLVNGKPCERKKIYSEKHQVLAINYELLLRDLDIIQKINFDLIILDEAQRIKNFETQTAKRVKTLKPFFRLTLTGTPMENRISELSSLLDWIKPAALGPYWRLNSELSYTDPSDPEIKGVKNLNAVRARIENSFIRRTRREVLPQVPSRTDTPIYLPITKQQKELHEEFAAIVAKLAAMSEVRPLSPHEFNRLMSNLTKMRVVSNGVAQLSFEYMWDDIKEEKSPEKIFNSLYSPKLQEFRNLIQGLLPQENVKIVIFSQWRRMLQLSHWAIQDLLSANDVEAVFFTGKVGQKKRTENICRFHDDPKVRLFFATDAGGVGLNLQRAANICINLELPWNPAILEQRIARIYRIGQNYPIQIFNLITQNCIEERILALVEQKRAVFNALFEGTNDEIFFSKKSGFYQQVKEIVVQEKEDSENIEENEIIKLSKIKNDEIEDINIVDKTDHPEKIEMVEAVEQITSEKAVDVQRESESNANNLFKDVKVEMKDGILKIEAKEKSALMMANMFKMMGKLFENNIGSIGTGVEKKS